MFHLHTGTLLSTLSRRTFSSFCVVSLQTRKKKLNQLFTHKEKYVAHKSIKNPAISHFSTDTKASENQVTICGQNYSCDHMTNVTPKILSAVERRLHCSPRHPLNHLKQRLVDFLYQRYRNKRGNPLFSVHDQLFPVVSVEQNFDQLLVPSNHVSRNRRDNYYINSLYLLRAHTSAHQHDLLAAGLDNFVVVGDVYRRDEIDSSHFPVFHQMEGVKLYTAEQLLPESAGGAAPRVLTGAPSTAACSSTDTSAQAAHTPEAVAALTAELQACLQGMATKLFGEDTECRWVSAYFPFTQPSWELEVLFEGQWLEVLGCGIMQQRILEQAGVQGKVGWAFGLGLERWAMKLYGIPDIRLFWSQDSGFLSQFDFEDHNKQVQYKAVSMFPQCTNDISFWLPTDQEYNSSDFYDLVRQIGGDIVEQVKLIDEFTHPKKGQTSHCYRIVYRHLEKTLTQEEVNALHKQIEQAATDLFRVTLR